MHFPIAEFILYLAEALNDSYNCYATTEVLIITITVFYSCNCLFGIEQQVNSTWVIQQILY